MLEVIGITNCDTIKKTKEWLSEKGISYSFRDLKKDPLSPNELAELVMRAGLDTLVNRKGRKWKMLGLSDKELSDNDLFEVLLEHQTMIKRPVLRKGEAIMVGFDEDALQNFIEGES
ncbi:MAG: Spx/MgsR family RNA polymerase-binding regulatory protein [Balneolaceae bacterium]|nr:MAG: Spx/MgsR family RNA polymerase-binding regulatory protein [Balneolaceae bacterium]